MVLRSQRIHRWTRDDLARLPDDGNRYEVLDGALLVTPQAAFGHQRAAWRLAFLIGDYCERHRIGQIVCPGAVPHGDSELQPDIQVIPGHHAFSAEWTELPTPILVVEVLSPSTKRRDFGIKRDAYLRWGVAEYWIVDIDARCVHVSRRDEEMKTVDTKVVWKPDAAAPACEIRVTELFA
jgi:Uma2 family endonuclease